MRITVGFGGSLGTAPRSRSRRNLPSCASNSEPIPVLIGQQILPPYRLALMQALTASSKIKMTIAYGEALPGSALDSLREPPKVNRLTVHNHFWKKTDKMVYQTGLMRQIRTGKYRVMVAEYNPRVLTNLAACLYAKSLGMQFIWWGHGIRPRTSPKLIPLYQKMASLADAMILYSGPGADQLAELGVPREKMFVAWNAIDIDDINAHAQAWEATTRTRVLYIGRLIAEKKIDLLIRAFALALPKLPPEAKLTLVGEGPERQHLEDVVKELKIESKVEFAGSMYGQADLAPYFNTSWVSVSPGYIGLSAIHSLGYGVPMLVADKEPHSPEIAAIEDGVNAQYFTANDPQALADGLVRMASQPGKLAEMSQAGRLRVQQQFSIPAMVQAFEQAVAYACRDHS